MDIKSYGKLKTKLYDEFEAKFMEQTNAYYIQEAEKLFAIYGRGTETIGPRNEEKPEVFAASEITKSCVICS